MGLAADAYQRMLVSLLPPGKLWSFVGSLLSDLLLALADELARFDVRLGDLINEADPATTVELLPEHERELDLESTGTTAERQARVVARTVARQRYRPADFPIALQLLFGLDPADIDVIERSHAVAVSMGDDREIFDFFIYRNPALPGTYYLDSAQDLVDDIKPSHTNGFVIESIDFLCDDPYSLCDRDILGA